jgi:predicted GNAT family N-acyltransferase
MNAPVRSLTAARPIYDSNSLEVAVATTLNDLMEVIALRAIVYMAEQVCPFDEEYDGNDFAGATHLIVRRCGEPVGVLRLRWFADFAKIERVAIRREERGRTTTIALVKAALEIAQRKGYRLVIGHVQQRLVPFWKRQFGFYPREGRERFVFSDHEYVEMQGELRPPPNALGLDTDPLTLLRPEGDWDRPGILDRSARRPATNPLGYAQ